MNFEVKHDLIHDGVKFSSGDILAEGLFSPKQENRLLHLGAIKKTHESVNVEISEESSDLNINIPELDEELEEVDLTDDDVKEEISAGFTHSDLIKEMEILEMDFRKNDSKENLIDLIISEEKDEHFLDLLEGR